MVSDKRLDKLRLKYPSLVKLESELDSQWAELPQELFQSMNPKVSLAVAAEYFEVAYSVECTIGLYEMEKFGERGVPTELQSYLEELLDGADENKEKALMVLRESAHDHLKSCPCK